MVLVSMLCVAHPSHYFDLRLLILSKKYLLKVFDIAKPLAELWSRRGRSHSYIKHDPLTVILHLLCFRLTLNENRNVWRFFVSCCARSRCSLNISQ